MSRHRQPHEAENAKVKGGLGQDRRQYLLLKRGEKKLVLWRPEPECKQSRTTGKHGQNEQPGKSAGAAASVAWF